MGGVRDTDLHVAQAAGKSAIKKAKNSKLPAKYAQHAPYSPQQALANALMN